MPLENKQILNELCENSAKSLVELRSELAKIMAIKSKKLGEVKDNVMVTQTTEIITSLKNFEQIHSEVTKAISDINNLQAKIKVLASDLSVGLSEINRSKIK